MLSGESWSQGQVMLSWDDVVEGAAVVDDGRNVVIHEFAHQLDQHNGHANGAPFLGLCEDNNERWARVLGEEFAGLQRAACEEETGALQLLRRDESRGVLRCCEPRCSSSRRSDGRRACGVASRADAVLSGESAELVGGPSLRARARTVPPVRALGRPGVECPHRRGG